MPHSLELYTRQTLFIVREGEATRKLAFPNHWNSATVTDDDQFLECLKKAQANGQRKIIVVSEGEFASALLNFREKVPQELQFRTAFIVLSKEPEKVLRERHESPELLDVFQEKDVRKSVEFHFLKAIRTMVRSEERGKTRISEKTLHKLNEIFIELSAERDPQKLLAAILQKSVDLVTADGGTLYMIQETDGEMSFRLRITVDRNKDVTFQQVQIKVLETSICGYVSLTGKLINIKDIADLKPLSLPQFSRAIDHYKDERTRSVVCLPLKNSRNEIIAILQLVNKKSERLVDLEGVPAVEAFESEDESLLSSFSTQASICLENVDLYADIQRLFEGFVRASITAIESRDPSTGGHSERVAKICVALAKATTECEVGIYRSVKFKNEEIRELEYAALLHDFGKIGVREEVLVKAKKLYAWQLDSIKERIKVCKAAAKISLLEKRLKYGNSSGDAALEKEYTEKIREIERYWEIILAANEPTVLKKDNMQALERIRNEQLILPDGAHIALLSEEEYKALSVTRGSLTDSERLEIESHVRHTYQFLKMIPWTKDFKHLPEIAYGHHEKLDGTGYPRGLTSHEIPLQSKIMTIADIYDALTAADRWYKEAVTTEKAIDILAQEVSQGKLDPVLFELFVEKKIYEVTQPKATAQVA